MKFVIAILILLVALRAQSTTYNIIITAGQSNQSGQGANNQPYSGADKLFGNDYVIKAFADPYDFNQGQIDTVSSDASKGSYWPAALTVLDSHSSNPFMVTPCPFNGSSILDWQPVGNNAVDRTNRTTLYGSMMYRLLQSGTNGTVLCVHLLEGETDAFNSMTQAAFQSNICYFADAIYSDAAVPTVICTIYHLGNVTQAQEDAINNAIRAAWGTHHILPGADLNVISADAPPHVTTDAGLTQAGGLVANNLIQDFFPTTPRYAPFRR